MGETRQAPRGKTSCKRAAQSAPAARACEPDSAFKGHQSYLLLSEHGFFPVYGNVYDMYYVILGVVILQRTR